MNRVDRYDPPSLGKDDGKQERKKERKEGRQNRREETLGFGYFDERPPKIDTCIIHQPLKYADICQLFPVNLD